LFILGVIFGLPQALFGLFSVVAGVSIIGWVLYNTFIVNTQVVFLHSVSGPFLHYSESFGFVKLLLGKMLSMKNLQLNPALKQDGTKAPFLAHFNQEAKCI
jgi:hypothetical protein